MVIGQVVQKPMPIDLRAIGNVQAYTTVSIKAQISGELTAVHFVEGQDVKKGDLLFTIDPRPFEATLKQAEANLKQAEANLKQAHANLAKDTAEAKNAEAEAARYAQLFKAGVAAAEQYDQFRTKADSSKAALQADESAIQASESAILANQAAIDTARLQLAYTAIRAPMDGRTGSLMVHQGNLVKANDVPILVVINQIHPIYVAFSVPEQYLPEVKRRMAQGKLKVQATPKDGGRPVTGQLTFVDNNIDLNTSTIILKGTFANEDNSLWPGQFLDTVLTLTTQKDAIVVPSQAIQTGQQGQFVFVVKPDSTVEARPVVVARRTEQETVIDKGLQPGERVVTEGQLRLVPGARVREMKAAPEVRP
ncbi:MAG: efflux RND transporter periplasmic adaptor subunit [Acidobacteria bacterium]|nr:efflux RND transporter periplasmic adaptor subunit [Acidobacteriota bacterium]